MDLGVYSSTLYNVSELGYFWKIFFGHTSPSLIIYSGIYSVFSVEGILFFQSLIIALSGYIIKKYLGLLPFVAYVLFFPVWFNALFDFHPDHLSILLLLCFFIFAQNNYIKYAAISAIALAFVKEPFALQTVACGIYLLFLKNELVPKSSSKFFTSSPNNLFYGFGLIGFGIVYFYIATSFVIPYFSGIEKSSISTYSSFHSAGSSISEIIFYIFNNFGEVLSKNFSNPDKVIYVVALFGSLGFISLLSPKALIVGLPILAISLILDHKAYYGLGHHYTAGLIAPLIFSFSNGLPRARIIWEGIGLPIKWFTSILLIGLLITHIALSPSPISRIFWSDKVWSYNYHAYIQTDRDQMIKQKISLFIPENPDVVVSIQNTLNWLPLVQRRHFLLFPRGISEVGSGPFIQRGLKLEKTKWKPIKSDFVVLDLKRPWSIIDKGCDWLYGKCTNKKVANEYLEWVKKTKRIMHVVFEKDGFIILKRKNYN
ncbi:DUF2079 domain-containing protein [Methylophilales bacterium]|nr:DUF2079 domain-containing protein [Methylophilales bacterium]